MIHAIVFTNRERGNQLYERTPNFPADAAEEIFELCNRLRVHASFGEEGAALRYQPLGERYLLSVIHRIKSGSGIEVRGHVASVNFLMDSQDADQFFRAPFSRAAKAAVDVAQKLLKFNQGVLPGEICGELLQQEGEMEPTGLGTPLPVLMTGAAYSLERQITDQLFVESDLPAVEELQGLLWLLPPPLRKKISFHTGCIDAVECHNLGICYCASGVLQNMLSSGFVGGPLTTKFWYSSEQRNFVSNMDERYQNLAIRLTQLPGKIPLYRLLRDAITDWTVYRELSLLVSGEPSLEEVLRCLPESGVLRIIHSGAASNQELMKLKRATKSGSPVWKAVQDLLNKQGSGDPTSEPSGLGHFLYRKRYWILVCVCALLVCFNFTAVLNGIGNDLVRELLLFAGMFGVGFFLKAALRRRK